MALTSSDARTQELTGMCSISHYISRGLGEATDGHFTHVGVRLAIANVHGFARTSPDGKVRGGIVSRNLATGVSVTISSIPAEMCCRIMQHEL